MSQGPLCPNLSQKVQKEVSKMANRNLSPMILLGGLSVNLNHLKRTRRLSAMIDLMKNGLKMYVKKNTQIVCNDRSNKEWAENVCKKEHTDCLQ